MYTRYSRRGNENSFPWTQRLSTISTSLPFSLLSFLHIPRSLLIWGLFTFWSCMDGPLSFGHSSHVPSSERQLLWPCNYIAFPEFLQSPGKVIFYHTLILKWGRNTMGKEMGEKSLFDSNEDCEKNITSQWKRSCTHCISGTKISMWCQ